MSGKSILVTGAVGFIGSHVSELLLKQNFNIIGIDNFDPFYDRSIKEENLSLLQAYPGFTFIEGDIRAKEVFESITQVDGVIHLAAKAGVIPSIKDPQGYIDTNITGTLNILNWMNDKEIKKFVFASSSSIYGNHPSIPYKENLAVDHPISPYAFTKKSCELLNYNYFHLYNIDVLNLRLFTVYGPRQRPDLAIHKFFRLIKEGKEIPVYGDGSTARDYTFVEDTANGIVLALKYLFLNSKVYDIINLGNSSPVRLLDLINSIGEAAGIAPKLKFLPMQPGDVDITYADITKATEILEYKPNTSLEEGLKKFYNWMEQKDN
jgi:nucleoside-diphosphate-sugar epimerase